MKRNLHLLWIVCFLVFVIVNGLWVYHKRSLWLMKSFESIRAKIVVEFAQGSENIHLITQNDVFNAYIQTQNLTNKKQVSELFINILNTHPRYDQIRFLDELGYEVIRAQREGDKTVVIEESGLQNKSTRYYFIDTMKLQKGEIYVSPLDLNMENKKIEDPLKPTVRMATPVFLEDQKIGMIIINYNASEILESVVRDIKENRPYLSVYLLNSDGYFIYHEDSSKTWGFMYPNKAEEVFYNYYPKVWNKIVHNEKGSVFSLKNGFFVYNKIYPIQECQQFELTSCYEFNYFSRGLSTRDFYLIIVGNASIGDVAREAFLHIIFPALVVFIVFQIIKSLLSRNRIIGKQ